MPALPTPSAVHLQVLLDQASLVGPGGSEGTASLQVNVSRSAGTGGTYEEHHCDLDDGDAAAGHRGGGGGNTPLGAAGQVAPGGVHGAILRVACCAPVKLQLRVRGR
ncbi:hypothetical protein Vretimale_20015 [Volvox reticuliferus]|uniref:Uncharacterized protein n=1 Tax=Volvox reticuliferus TaxID=1737510 RepID=A0A8J4H158_9CHLO|nr:hypothetical protein Vretimale_20015 [Volvox reticuliferus]